mgnify:CR=1 FL=1
MMEAHRQKRALQEWFPAPSFPEQQTPPEQGEVLLPAVLLHQEQQLFRQSSSSVSQEGPGGRNGATGDTNHGPGVAGGSLPAAVLLVRAALHPAAMM